MNLRKTSKTLALLLISLVFVTNFAYSSTPEKPYPALSEGDRLTAAWLMGMFNVIYDWAQTINNDFSLHGEATAAHGATGVVVGTTNSQTLTSKTLDSTNSIAGEAIKSGTVADARIASTIARDSEVTSAVSTKQATITGAATTITSSNLTASRALISNGSGKVGASTVTSTEIGYVGGVTSAIQTQLNAKAASSHTHNYAGSSSAGGAATSALTATTANGIRTSAPTSPVNGDIWLE